MKKIRAIKRIGINTLSFLVIFDMTLINQDLKNELSSQIKVLGIDKQQMQEFLTNTVFLFSEKGYLDRR